MRALAYLVLISSVSAERLPLSLKRAVEIALAPEGSARVRLAEETIRQAEARAAQSRGILLPNLDGSIADSSQTRNLRALGLQLPSLPGLQFPALVGPFDVFDVRATLSQTAFDLGAIRRYQAARTGVEAARAEMDSARDEVTEQVARAYLAGLRAEAALETARANVELSEALVKLAGSQKAAGTGTGIEVTRAEVQLANDRQRLLVAENDVRRAHLQLLKVMGLRLDTTVELTDRLDYRPVEITRLEQGLETARTQRAELKAQQKREETARLNYRATRLERLPSVGAFADYGSIGSAITSALPTRTIGISVKLPVFDGGRRDARRAESLSQLRQERIRARDLAEQVELEVRLAIDGLRSADAQVAAAREGLGLAESELVQARRRYQAGVANSIEVTDAQTRLQRARDNQIAALYNYNLAQIELAAATGAIQEFLRK